jgi:hypothetical protein
MNIKRYIAEANKEYHLRLKTIVPLDDEAMDKIEMCVAKYQLLAISRPIKTILQRAPLDFPNVESGEVYIVDMSFGLPTAPHIIRADIRKALNAPENYVFVRNKNEPGEIQSEIANAVADIEAEAFKKGLKLAAILDDPDYNIAIDYEQSYGNAYNSAFLGYLASVEKERKDAIQRVETAPFNWLDLPDRKDQEPVQDDSNFNAHIKDAPVVGGVKASTPKVNYSVFGSFDPSANEIRRVYKDDKGNKVVLTRKLGDANA